MAYTHCNTLNKDSVAQTLDQIDVIKRLIAKNPKDLKFVTTADGKHLIGIKTKIRIKSGFLTGINEAFHEKRIASLICVEGGHSIDSRMAVLRLYYELGVRYMTLTHNCNLPW